MAVLDLGGPERHALHLGERAGRRPGTRPAPAGESWPRLTSGTSTLAVAAEHLAEVGRERVEVDEVGVGHLQAPGPHPADAGGDGPVGRAPAEHQHLGVAGLVVDLDAAGCRAAMPAILAARSRTIRSWLAGS